MTGQANLSNIQRSRFVPALSSGLLGLLLVSCADREMPTEPVLAPSAFMQATPDIESDTELPTLQDEWWREFGDAYLNEAIAMALSDNFTIKQAWNRLEQANALAKQAGAAEYPTADIVAGAEGAWNLNTGNRTEGYSVGLQTSYEVDLWGRIASQVDAAAFDAASRQADVQAAAITLAGQVVNVWYQLAAARERVAVLEEQLATNQSTLELIGVRFTAGQSRAADYYRQKQLVAATAGDLAQARAQVSTNRHALSVLVGRTPGDLPETWRPQLVSAPLTPTVGLPAAVLARRPDIQSSWLQVAAANQRVEVADADRYPRLTIGVDLTASSTSLSDLLDGWILRLAGNLAQPLFDGGRRRAEVERTEAVLRERVNAYGEVVLGAIQEVEDALVEERQQQAFVQRLQEQVTANGNVLERTQELYLAGVFDYLRVLEALTSNQSLSLQMIIARRDVLLRRLDLYRAVAGRWDVPVPSEGVDTDQHTQPDDNAATESASRQSSEDTE